ncbi:HNH endonuclease [Megamonas funiformis]|uniref:HNH endonuclease n=1 Tax=Megamonas funiformis TaxID=437897 RepID=UPI0039F6358D
MCKCIKCNNKIIFNGPNKNASVEHIIPNAIGGKLKSSKLLCKKCNSDYGKECDSVLCKQLEFITVMLNPSRDRQTNLTFKTSSNEKYDISLNGKPV